MPLGAAALAGTSFPIDREMTAKALGFDGPTRNSLDAVSDRDAVLEFLAAASICAVHLSRLAEEIVIWMSAPFGFVRLPDRWTTGSSIMPQKRNPDAAELVRGKAGPDFRRPRRRAHHDEGPPARLFEGHAGGQGAALRRRRHVEIVLAATTGMMQDLEPVPERMAAVAGAGFSTATDLADWLVRQPRHAVPRRPPRHRAGIVAEAERRGCGLEDLPLEAMQAVEPRIHSGDLRGARGRELRPLPYELRRHRARRGSPSRSPGGRAASKSLSLGTLLALRSCFPFRCEPVVVHPQAKPLGEVSSRPGRGLFLREQVCSSG